MRFLCKSLRVAMPVFVFVALLTSVSAQDIPDHPNKLKFPELKFEVPSREGMRHTLKNGMTLWWAQDKGAAGLPALFRLEAVIKTSDMLDPAGKTGLGSFTMSMMREGGTATHSREKLNRELDLRAASLGADIDENYASASVTCLHRDHALCLQLYSSMLRQPAFNQADVDRVRAQWLQSIRHRNDDPSGIEGREWSRLLFGDHPSARSVTRASVEAITIDDMKKWHQQYVQPQNIMLYGSGSLSAGEAVKALDTIFAEWKPTGERNAFTVPEATQAAKPGIYLMHRDQAQAHLRIGLVAYQREFEDYYPLIVMNQILGGGAFSSRITQEVRVKEGLSYAQGCRFAMPDLYKGDFMAYVQTKNETLAFAARLVMREIARIRDEAVSETDLETAKQFFIGAFPQQFSTRGNTVQVFALAEYNGRPENYQEEWRNRIAAVTIADVQRVAKKYLKPDQLVIYALGDVAKIRQGSSDHAIKLADLGMPVTELPLPEPENLTVVPKTPEQPKPPQTPVEPPK
ncbi:MAG: insulinase family protein [Planctomycetaceae bacterium]|nr:insulinase family protein [Planctomycetaceae bacterium]